MYPKDKVLDSTYKRKIQEFDFAKEEKEKVKDIYTIFNYDGKLQIFLIETKTLSIPLVRCLRFLLILTTDYKDLGLFGKINKAYNIYLTRNVFKEAKYYLFLL
jgi:hypothetical protein